MGETQDGGVERLASECGKRRPGSGPKPRGLGVEPGAIDRGADQRMTDGRQMDPDLVRPAGLEPAGEQGCRA